MSAGTPTPTDPRLVQLGRALRAMRRERDVSQEALAGAARIHPNQVSRLERGIGVSASTLLAIVDGLDVGLADLGAAYDARREPTDGE